MSSKKASQTRGKKSRRIRYSDLSGQELDKIAAAFDREMIPDKPLTAVQRRQLNRAKRKRGRPTVGEGAQQVLVTIERGVLRAADEFALKHNKNRSQLIVEALRQMMARPQRRRAS